MECRVVSRTGASPPELRRFGPKGRVLELACGTGLWTVELARHAAGITAVDASPEVLDINRARLQETLPEVPVRYVRADLFDWRPEEAYDVAFFGFWLSHVPPGRFAAFWDLVRAALRPGGRAFFVDSLAPKHGPRRRAPGGPQRPHDAQTTQRRAGVQDRPNLLRPCRARSAPRRHGLALLGAHDRETPALRFRRAS